MLVVRDCTVCYQGAVAVRGVSLEVRAGECLGIIGPNGAGKTSLLKAILGLVEYQGRILFDGRDVTRLAAERRVRLGMALVPEGRGLLGSLTVGENLRLGLYPISGRERASRARQAYDYVFTLFPRLKERLNQPARSLSGGEQQMLALGRALMSGPRLLLLDEPTFGLAPALSQRVAESLAVLKAEGLTLVVVEQKLPLVMALCDRVVVMSGGKIALVGQPSDLATAELLRLYLAKPATDR
ncbi:MAG: ABC transporter ATP-binding protein [Chloroflexota bacterium]